MAKVPAPLPELIDARTLREHYGIAFTRQHCATMERNGFPRRVRLGHRTVRWRRSEVETWIASKLEARAA